MITREENTRILSDGRIELFLKTGEKYIQVQLKDLKGLYQLQMLPVISITSQTKRESDTVYKGRTCRLWLETEDIKPIHELIKGYTETDTITEVIFENIDDIIKNSKSDGTFFKLEHAISNNDFNLYGKFSDIINYIILIDNNSNIKEKIRTINFKINELTGVIPKNLGKFINVTSIQLQYNNLSGIIPEELGNLVNLIEFDIYENNNITGLIPNTFVNLTKLEKINTKETSLIQKHKIQFTTLNETQNFLKSLNELTYNGVKLGKGLLSLFRGLNANYFNGSKTYDIIQTELNLNKELIELGLEISEIPNYQKI